MESTQATLSTRLFIHSFTRSFTPRLTLRVFTEERLSAGPLPSPGQDRGAKPANPGRVTDGRDRRQPHRVGNHEVPCENVSREAPEARVT